MQNELTAEEFWLVGQLRKAGPYSTIHLFRQKGKIKRLVIEDSILAIGFAAETLSTGESLPPEPKMV